MGPAQLVTRLASRLDHLEKHTPAAHVVVIVRRDGDPDPDTERVHTCPGCGHEKTARGALTRVVCVPCAQRSTSTTPPAGAA